MLLLDPDEQYGLQELAQIFSGNLKLLLDPSIASSTEDDAFNFDTDDDGMSIIDNISLEDSLNIEQSRAIIFVALFRCLQLYTKDASSISRDLLVKLCNMVNSGIMPQFSSVNLVGQIFISSLEGEEISYFVPSDSNPNESSVKTISLPNPLVLNDTEKNLLSERSLSMTGILVCNLSLADQILVPLSGFKFKKNLIHFSFLSRCMCFY